MAGESVANQLVGEKIKEIFQNAERIAELHGCLTSPRGNHFRFRLLQATEVPLDESGIEQLRVEAGIKEYQCALKTRVGGGTRDRR